ncbi:pilus assembly protein TadG-related protein [Agromyces sp. H66]|uniref:TadE/TadG family type IV pilus assembly protein n=1 Tax=Agromyces sp. H66 TaxID=2529859 RepID=UPI0010AAAAA5|nr:pilus assembly protein TadG-related protein [Agromyces sp. H66]
MRRLMRRFRDERGATATVVAFALIPLLGAGAIAIDVGALYAERAKLQNGADAAALAVALDCAAGDCGTYVATAGGYANANDANDGAAEIHEVRFATIDGADVVTVTTKTREADGSNELRHPLAQLIGIDATTVGATASATWDGVGGGYSFPFSVSACQADPLADPGIIGDGVHYTIRFDTEPEGKTSELDCDIAHNGHVIDGGFGWLDPISKDDCRAYTSIEDGAVIEPGNAVPNGCKDDLDAAIDEGRIVYLPVHYGELAHKTYDIRVYVGFRITGYSVSGGERLDPEAVDPVPACKEKGNDCRFLQGEFVEVTTTDPGVETGGPGGGAMVVKLTLTPAEVDDLIN